MEIKLKPCPFCKNKFKTRRHPVETVYILRHKKWCFIKLENEIYYSVSMTYFHENDREFKKIAEAWNRRVKEVRNGK